MTTTILTTEQIEALRSEADHASDGLTVALCDLALGASRDDAMDGRNLSLESVAALRRHDRDSARAELARRIAR